MNFNITEKNKYQTTQIPNQYTPYQSPVLPQDYFRQVPVSGQLLPTLNLPQTLNIKNYQFNLASDYIRTRQNPFN